MTNEERDLITAFITRVAGAAPAPAPGAASATSPWGAPSVPATTPPPAPPLPPIDPEADALLASLFQRYPEARYRLAQLAFVQEHALSAAQARIRQLEAQLRQPAPAQPHGGFFSGLFGGGRPAPAPMPMPMPPQAYPPGYPQAAPPASPAGMLGRSGPGFLGSALTTAAGVAGGMMLGNALMDMFSHNAAQAGGTVPGDQPSTDALWAPPSDPNDSAGWANADPSGDPGGWTDPGADPSAGVDPGAADPGDGGWDQGGGDWDQGGGADDIQV
jgi:hypothetical protein